MVDTALAGLARDLAAALDGEVRSACASVIRRTAARPWGGPFDLRQPFLIYEKRA